MFSQASNNPQNSLHLHSLKAEDTLGEEWALCSSWPAHSQAEFPGWLVSVCLSVSCLPLPGGGMSTHPNCCWHWFWVFHLDIWWKLACPPHCVSQSCGTTTASAAPTASVQPLMGLRVEAEKKSRKIDLIHENYRIVYFTCHLSVFSV